jgi:hypothetical protein
MTEFFIVIILMATCTVNTLGQFTKRKSVNYGLITKIKSKTMTPTEERELEYYRQTMPAVIRHNRKLERRIEILNSRIIELHMELDEGAIRIIEEKEDE